MSAFLPLKERIELEVEEIAMEEEGVEEWVELKSGWRRLNGRRRKRG